MTVEKSKCNHCGYRWFPRTANPVKCPECQHRWPLGKPKGKSK